MLTLLVDLNKTKNPRVRAQTLLLTMRSMKTVKFPPSMWMMAAWAVEAPVTLLRVYCSWPGVLEWAASPGYSLSSPQHRDNSNNFLNRILNTKNLF